jgi:hypothetical protein
MFAQLPMEANVAARSPACGDRELGTEGQAKEGGAAETVPASKSILELEAHLSPPRRVWTVERTSCRLACPDLAAACRGKVSDETHPSDRNSHCRPGGGHQATQSVRLSRLGVRLPEPAFEDLTGFDHHQLQADAPAGMTCLAFPNSVLAP